MFSLDFFDKVAKRRDLHSTTVVLHDFFDKDHTSLNITSTPLDSLNKVAKRLEFLLDSMSSKKSSEKMEPLGEGLKQ